MKEPFLLRHDKADRQWIVYEVRYDHEWIVHAIFPYRQLHADSVDAREHAKEFAAIKNAKAAAEVAEREKRQKEREQEDEAFVKFRAEHA
jgi:hypothetical protein